MSDAQRASTLTVELFRLGQPFVEAHLTHPVVAALQEGTLGEGPSRTWLEQDYLYLLEEKRVLARLAWKAPPAAEAELLALLKSVDSAELAAQLQLCALFEGDPLRARPVPVTAAYTSWLLAAASDYALGMTALLSGLWVYSTVGQQLTLPSEPRQRQWLESYKDPAFPALAARIAAMVDEAAPDPSRAISTFLSGLGHSVAFWGTS